MGEEVLMKVSQHSYQHAALDVGEKNSIPGERQAYGCDSTWLFHLASHQPQRRQCFLLLEVKK